MPCIEYIRKEVEKKKESYKNHLNREVQAIETFELEKILKKAEKLE